MQIIKIKKMLPVFAFIIFKIIFIAVSLFLGFSYLYRVKLMRIFIFLKEYTFQFFQIVNIFILNIYKKGAGTVCYQS